MALICSQKLKHFSKLKIGLKRLKNIDGSSPFNTKETNCIRHLGGTTVQTYPDTSIGTTYNSDDQNTILDILNTWAPANMQQFNITKTKASAIASYRKKHGDYKKLDDVLEVDGFGLNILQKFYDSIVYGSSEDTKRNQARNMQFCYPSITKEVRQKLTSVVAVHVNNLNAVWVHLNRDRTVLAWNNMPLAESAQNYNHAANLETAQEIVRRLPKADMYLLEHRRLRNKMYTQMTKPKTPPIIPGMLQLESMITVLLNMENGALLTDKVLTTKNSVVSHFFQLVVGGENTSGQAVVESLVTGRHSLDIPRLTIDEIVWRLYSSQLPVVKENMSTVLLHAITFYELEVNRHSRGIVKNSEPDS